LRVFSLLACLCPYIPGLSGDYACRRADVIGQTRAHRLILNLIFLAEAVIVTALALAVSGALRVAG
jgi:hypothetical protein